MNKALHFVLPILIAVVLGPLIAGLAVEAFAIVYSFLGRTGSLLDALGMATFYLTFAYVIGGPIALLAGLFVSVWMIWRQPNVIVVFAGAVIATAAWLGIGALGILGPVLYANARANFLFILSFAIIAAAGCWLLTRRFARPA